MSFRTMDFKSIAYCQVSPRPHDIGPDADYAIAVVVPMSTASAIVGSTAEVEIDWRRRADSNRRITDLQSAALPLGYGAVPLSSRRSIAYLRDGFQLDALDGGLMRYACAILGAFRRT